MTNSDAEQEIYSDQPIPAAYQDADWYPLFRSETEYATKWMGLYKSVGTRRLPDAHTTYVKVRDGVRATWSPPPCDCQRLTVWAYGSATLFGPGQRDDFTIPSQLAKRAWQDGIALDIKNRSVPGDQHWQEANRLAWDLSHETKPDLVFFYDGVSDVNGASWLASRHLGDLDLPIEPLTEEFLAMSDVQVAVNRSLRGDETEAPPLPAGLDMPTSTTVPDMSPEEIGTLAAARYTDSRAISKTSLSAYWLPAVWFWQPARVSRPAVPGEPVTPDDGTLRAAYASAAQQLPKDVVDLSGAFSGVPEPIYGDDVRHNERGASIIANDAYGHLRPTISKLLSTEGA